MSKKLITIVGIGPGISSAVARKFAKEDFRLALVARNEERLLKYKEEFESTGVEVSVYKADAGDESSLIEAFEKLKTNSGSTDVLLYNVFAMRQSTPLRLKYDELITDFKINVAGALLSSQLVLPDMIQRKEGCILFTGGGLSLEPVPVYSSLGVGKAGLRNLCFSLYGELKSKGIHAATVTVTGFVKAGTKWDPDLIAEEFWKLYLQKQPDFQREIII